MKNDKQSVIGMGEIEFLCLRMSASNCAQRFCAPIYLVGSAINKTDPMDVDILMIATKDQFRRLIGDGKKINDGYNKQEPTREYIRSVRFIQKQKQYFEKHNHGFDVDFKITMWDEFVKNTGPKVRLDCFSELF